MEAKHVLAWIVGLISVGIASGDEEMGHQAPQSVTATCAMVSADVGWAAVQDAHLSGYDVYRRASGASEYTKANLLLVTGTSFTVVGLSSGILYEFRAVAAYNDGHTSPMSAAAFCTTA